MKKESLSLPEPSPTKAKFMKVVLEGDKWVLQKAEIKRIGLHADRRWLAAIDEWRKIQDWPYPSMSEAIRQLVEIGLEASERNDEKPKS